MVEFAEMGEFCDDKHEHLTWDPDPVKKQFKTGEEAEYPKLFCERMAACVRKWMLNKLGKEVDASACAVHALQEELDAIPLKSNCNLQFVSI